MSIQEIKDKISGAALASGRQPSEILLLAVSKTVEPSRMEEAMREGVTLFGENYVQELLSKYDSLHEKGARFHFIGHLQTNKVKYIIDKVEMIHSVDSKKLADEISKQAKKHGITVDVLIEVNVAGEASKSGIAPEMVPELAEHIDSLSNVRLRGLMCIPPFDAEGKRLEGYFKQVNQLFVDMKDKKTDNNDICFLSMGMSSDFEQAIACGSNMVRVGTAIFGARNYNKTEES